MVEGGSGKAHQDPQTGRQRQGLDRTGRAMTGSPIAVFYAYAAPKRREGWYWDDAEDHGGFDRVSPQGPFNGFDDAKADAVSNLGAKAISRIETDPPYFYPDN